MPSLLLLSEVKDVLNVPSSTSTFDVAIQAKIDAAVGIIEGVTGGPLFTATVVERVSVSDGCRALALRSRPVVAVQSIVDVATSVSLAVTGLDIDTNSGIVRLASQLPFAGSGSNYTVTYTAGWGATSVPAAFKEAGMVIVAHLWRLQRGPYSEGETAGVPGMELLANYAQEAYF